MALRMSQKVRNHGAARQNTSATANTAKITIRRRVLEVIGVDKASVFDAFAGSGVMHKHIWSEAASYTGCDLEFYSDDNRLAFAADNRRVLRAIDLDGFNLFDLDAYGSPWEQLYIIASRRKLQPGEAIGVCLTEGQGLKLKMGGMSSALAKLSGITLGNMQGLGSAQSELIDRAIRRIAQIMDGDVVRRWEATGKFGSSIRYIGLVLLGKMGGALTD